MHLLRLLLILLSVFGPPIGLVSDSPLADEDACHAVHEVELQRRAPVAQPPPRPLGLRAARSAQRRRPRRTPKRPRTAAGTRRRVRVVRRLLYADDDDPDESLR